MNYIRICFFLAIIGSAALTEPLLADKGYDTDAILEQAKSQGMEPVIPPKKNRVIQREYDEELYKLRHLVENALSAGAVLRRG